MEYQKIITLLDNTSNQPSNFITKNWIETKDESRGTYNQDNQVRFETSVFRSRLFDYGDAYILVKRIITVKNKITEEKTNNAANKL